MGKLIRGKRDGTGPYKDSYKMKTVKDPVGTRKEEGEDCPVKFKDKKTWRL